MSLSTARLARPLARAAASPRQTPVGARSLFGLPSFPFSSPSSSSHPGKGTLKSRGPITIYEETREMAFTPQQLYSIIADVDSYTAFLPFATVSKVLNAVQISESGKEPRAIGDKGWLTVAPGGRQLDKDGDKWELEAELKIGAMGYEEGYVSKVETKKWQSVAATAKDSKLFRHLITRWTLSPLPPISPSSNPRTKVDLTLEYTFTSPFHAAAVSTVWEKVSSMMVSGFENRVKDVYGKPR